MHITKQGSLFCATGPTTELKSAGWKWLAAKQSWITGNKAFVVPFLHACDDKARQDVEAWVQKRSGAVAASLAADVDLDIPCPPGQAYRPYQKAGIAFMRGTPASLNADVPRLGKTIMALGVANMYERPLNILVVCPANAKINWCEEATKWLVYKTTVDYAEGKEFPDTAVVAINYDILSRHIDAINAREWDIVVADEAHYLKNPRAVRTTSFFAINRPNLHTFFLTGTPVLRHPIDLWPLLQSLDPKDLGANFWRFCKTYCGACAENGWDKEGATHSEQLQYKMRKTFMIRREKKDVGSELPSITQMIPLPPSGLLERLPEEETDAVNDSDSETNRISDIIKHAWAIAGEHGADVATRVLDKAADQYLHLTLGTREQLARRKVPMVVDFCKEQLETEPKIVVFAFHRKCVDGIAEGLEDYNPVVVKGGLTTVERDKRIKAFKNDPSVRVIVANIRSGGVAISLKEADVSVFAEMGSNGEVTQAKDRVWDLTKENPVAYFFLIVQHSPDVGAWMIYKARQEIIDKLMKSEHLNITL